MQQEDAQSFKNVTKKIFDSGNTRQEKIVDITQNVKIQWK